MTYGQRICTVLGTIGCLIFGLACQAAPAAEPKRVLLLYYSFGGNLVTARQFRAELERQSKELLEIYDAPLLSARPVDEPIVRRYADYLNALLPDKRLDLVVPVGASAARLLYQYRSQLFPAAPVLAIAEGRRLPAELEVNGAVIATSIDITKIIENILQVRPETTNIAVVVGNSPNERFWVQETQAAFWPYAKRVSIEYFNDLPFDEMLKRAATLPPRSAIFFFVLLTDAAGTTHEDVTVFSRLYAVANAPIFSYYDVNFGKGIVGGPLLSVENRARMAASVALRILAGEVPGSIKTPPIGFAAPKFDWREMQRWGISESNLPPGSEIHFRELTAWERYRAQILAISALILLQAALIGFLIYEHRRRHLAEVLARSSMAELTHMNRVATAGELSASIAHEIRQPLTGIVASASAARRWLEWEKPDIDKAKAALNQIESAGHRANDIIVNVRSMFRKDAQDKSWIDINKLIGTVLELLRIDLRKHQIDFELELYDQIPPVFGNQVQLQQVILNLIMNAIDSMRSVQPRVLSVKSKLNGHDSVQLSIEDTGIGIDPANLAQIFKPMFTTKKHGMGMGLSICQSIIELHEGKIWVTAGNNGGTIFSFELPTKAV
jgi:signal transduction histidine kinase